MWRDRKRVGGGRCGIGGEEKGLGGGGWKTLGFLTFKRGGGGVGILTIKGLPIVVNTGRKGGAGSVEDVWMARGLLDF